MKMKSKFLLSILLVAVVGYFSCRKSDTKSVTPEVTKNQGRFFNDHPSNDPLVQAITKFVLGQNEKYHFVEKLVKQIGYPHWDKAIVTSGSRSKKANRSNSDSTNTVFIPFALEDQTIVDASLVVTTNPVDTTFQFLCDWQYHGRTNGSPSVDTTAENFALLFMTMDNLVFGHTRFTITDSNLFRNSPIPPGTTGREIVLNISGNRQTGTNRSQTEAIEYCYYNFVCVSWEWYCKNLPNGCDYLNCPLPPPNNCHMTSQQCAYYDEEPGSGGGGDGSGGGGSGSPGSGDPGGGGDGGGGWNPPPCPGIQVRAATYDNCTPGWIPPTPPPPPNCDPLIGALENDATFKGKFMSLNEPAVTSGSVEKGFTVGDRVNGNYTAKQGIPGQPFIQWNLPAGVAIDGLLHAHFHLLSSIFSPDDILFFAHAYIDGYPRIQGDFFFGVTSETGSPYLIKVANPTKFLIFAQRIIASEATNSGFSTSWTSALDSGNPGLNEVGFFKMLEGEHGLLGLQLYRATPTNTGSYDFNNWEKLSWDGAQVSSTPCN